MSDPRPLALVTGANSGLGYAVSQQLAASGRYRVLAAARTLEKSEAAIAQMLADVTIPVGPGSTFPLALDLDDDTSIQDAVRSVDVQFGSLDILINCAGVNVPDAGSLRDRYRVVFDTNVFGAAMLLDSFLRLLRASTYRDRRIVNVTSGAGQIGLALSSDDRYNAETIPAPIYRASKSALNMITAVHSMVLAREGIACLVAHLDRPVPGSAPAAARKTCMREPGRSSAQPQKETRRR